MLLMNILATIPNVQVVTASDMTITVKSELSGLLQTAYIFGGAVWAIAAHNDRCNFHDVSQREA